MSSIVAYPVSNKGEQVLLVEVETAELSDDLQLASRQGTTLLRAQTSIETAFHQLQAPLRRMVDSLRDISPSETTIEFGLNLAGETGVVIARGSAAVNFTVTLKWTK